jgi:hypothetical protein
MDTNVKINEVGEINLTVHIRGLRAWRFRIMLVGLLLRVIAFVAPKNVHVSACDECSREID